MTQISARKICCWGFSIPIHIHTDYRGPVGEKGLRGHSLKRRVLLSTSATPLKGELHDPCLDKLLLVSQVPYIKEGPLFYAKVCFGWLSLQTQERVLLNTSKEDICNVKGEVVQIARFHTWKV